MSQARRFTVSRLESSSLNLLVSQTERGHYYFHSSDLDDRGPFDSLAEVLAGDEFGAETANPELTSEVLTSQQLKEIALPLVAEGKAVWINGWEFLKVGETLVEQLLFEGG